MAKRFYLHKEDVWSNAPLKMSSASRDIFEHYYLAVRNTFYHQFKDCEDIVGMIINVREWRNHCSSILSEAAKNKNPNIILPSYVEGMLPLPEEHRFHRDELIKVKDSDYDPKIYSSFDDFFKNADHGYCLDEKGRVICGQIYRCFIQGVTREKLLQQLDYELKQEKDWVQNITRAFIVYINSDSQKRWHPFLLEYFEKNKLYE